MNIARYRTGAAALGAGALCLLAGSTAASAEPAEAVAPAGGLLGAVMAGPDVLDELGADELAHVASTAGLSVAALEDLLRSDQTVRVSPSGHLFHADPATAAGAGGEAVSAPEGIPGDPSSGSRPGAPLTIFLDFDGATIENTEWNSTFGSAQIVAEAWAGATMQMQELIWAQVAEDYAPFDVNVTTTDPGGDALYKTSETDQEYGAHVVILGNDEEMPGELADVAGAAWTNWFGAEYFSPTLIMADKAGQTVHGIADTAAHEVGHNLGLAHHGFGEDAYYYPQPAAPENVWGPIMGSPYDSPLTQWSNGDYAGATNPDQDDLATMTDADAMADIGPTVVLFEENGELWLDAYCTDGDPTFPQPGDSFWKPTDDFLCEPPGDPLVARFDYAGRTAFVDDDHGDDTDAATELDNSGGEFSTEGVIGETGDVDVFALLTDGGPVTLSAQPADVGPNLDLKVSVIDASGAIVAENDPAPQSDGVPLNPTAAGLGASIGQDLPAGAYHVRVEGTGFGDPADSTAERAGGYTTYASLGHYSLSGTAEPFDAAPVAITAPVDDSLVEPTNLQVAGTAEPGATVEIAINGVVEPDPLPSVVTAGEDGSWAYVIESLRFGSTTIEAQETVGGVIVPEVASVTVTVPLGAPVILQPEDGQTTEVARPTFSGTGVPGATVTLSIEAAGAADAEAVEAALSETRVDGEGSWSVVPESDLANGGYTVVATQTVDDLTSAPSERIGFSVDAATGDAATGDAAGGDAAGAASGTDESGAETGGTDLPDTGTAASSGLIGLAAAVLVLSGAAIRYAMGRGRLV